MKDFIAVLVLYKLSLQKSATYLSINRSLKVHRQILDLIVYDNTPEYNTNLSSSNTPINIDNVSITYIPDYENSGVSKAYNRAQSIGKSKGKKWLLLLDQDTNFPENTISKYISAVLAYPSDLLFAPIMIVDQEKIVSPCHFKFMRGFSLRSINTGVNSLKKYSIINSGMCIDNKSFKINDGYNEKIKLDFSDHDFIKRFKTLVGDRFIVIDLKVCHQLSSTITNSTDSDFARFDYYLQGAKHISVSLKEKLFLQINAFIRACKLSFNHRNFCFMIMFAKNIFK